MSEFTQGYLVRSEQMDRVTAILNEAHVDWKVLDLSGSWTAFFLPYSGAPETDWGLVQSLAEVPVLWFRSFEDHEWGYVILHAGDSVASLSVEYDALEEMVFDEFPKRYPGVDSTSPEGYGLFRSVVDELAASPALADRIRDRFATANPEAFALFGVESERIAELKGTLRPDFVGSTGTIWDQVRAFKSLLGIEEMEYVNFERLD